MEMYMKNEHLIDSGLRVRLALYAILSIGIVSLIVYHIIRDQAGFIFPLGALAIGCVAGSIFSRILHISWDHNARKVISRLDAYGFVIFVVYIILEFFRDQIVAHFIHGPAVAATSLALLGGLLFGRILGMRGRIKETIEKNS